MLIVHDLTPMIGQPASAAPADAERMAAWFVACPAYQLVPRGMRDVTGKLHPSNATDYVNFYHIAVALDAQCDSDRIDDDLAAKMREALAVDLPLMLTVWDSNLVIAMNATGTRAAVLAGRGEPVIPPDVGGEWASLARQLWAAPGLPKCGSLYPAQSIVRRELVSRGCDEYLARKICDDLDDPEHEGD